MSHSQRVCFLKNHKQYFVVKTAVNRGLSYRCGTPAKKKYRHTGDTTSRPHGSGLPPREH